MSGKANGSDSVAMSLMGLLYGAMSRMAGYDTKMMKQQLDYMIHSARSFGGWSEDGKSLDLGRGIVMKLVDATVNSAKASGQATEDEAYGQIASAGISGLSFIGMGAAAYKLGSGDVGLEAQSKDINAFKEALNDDSLKASTLELRENDSETISDKQQSICKLQEDKNKLESKDLKAAANRDAQDLGGYHDKLAELEKKRTDELNEIDKKIAAKQAEIDKQVEAAKIEARIAEWTSPRPKLAGFQEDEVLNRKAIQHLKTDKQSFESLKQKVSERSDELSRQIQSASSSRLTNWTMMIDQISKTGSSGAQAGAHVYQAGEQVDSGEYKAMADTLQTAQQGFSSQIERTSQRGDEFSRDALAIAAAYGQLTQTHG